VARTRWPVGPVSPGLFSGFSELFAGHLGQAHARYNERGAIEAARGGSCEVGHALVLAWRGRAAEARAEAAAAAQVAVEQGEGWKLALLEYARAVLALGMGHYEEALAAAPHGYKDNVLLRTFALPDLIEAAVRCGERGTAEQAVASVASRAAASPTPLMLGLLARSRALLGSETGTEAFYREAISYLQQARGRVHLARVELVYGEWLRRERRQRDAREHLQAAYGMFRKSEPMALPNARGSSWLRPGGRPGILSPPRAVALRPKNSRSRRWRLPVSPTWRSPRGCSSARRPSTTTSGRSSGNSVSAHVASSPASPSTRPNGSGHTRLTGKRA
jgi:hypothetical protein